MMGWLRSLPLFVVLPGLGISGMYIPMIFAIRLQDWLVARTLFYHTTFLASFPYLGWKKNLRK